MPLSFSWKDQRPERITLVESTKMLTKLPFLDSPVHESSRAVGRRYRVLMLKTSVAVAVGFSSRCRQLLSMFAKVPYKVSRIAH